ncbi:MAG TPA: hypothetical protein VN914_01940 [Polyangia bacterium]|nr:hypothetical protein [Polyangia bacterium]
MKLLVTTIVGLVALSPGAARAQGARTFEVCDVPAQAILKKDERLANKCKFLFVLNAPQMRLVVGKDENEAHLVEAFVKRMTVTKEMLDTQGKVVEAHQRIEKIEGRSHDELLKRYDQLEADARAAVDNTKQALGLAHKARIASYVSAGLLGGGAGALAGSRVGDGAAPPVIGGLLGAGLALGVDWLVLKVLQ